MTEPDTGDINRPDDRRLEETLQEVLVYVHGISLLQGTHQAQSEFVGLIADFPLYQMFNTNVIARIESELISKTSVRDFVLTLFTQLMTTLRLRDNPLTVEQLITKLGNSYVSNFNPGIVLKDSNKTLIKSLTDSVIPVSKKFPAEYLAHNEWYIVVVLINVFSISIIKVMDEVKRPPVNNQGR